MLGTGLEPAVETTRPSSTVVALSRRTRERSLTLAAESRQIRERVRSMRLVSRRASHFAYLHAELSGWPVVALVRRDGSAAGHVRWLRLARCLIPLSLPAVEKHSSIDPMVTVLSLSRTCDQLTALHLLDAGSRGVYPESRAVASLSAGWSPLNIDVDEWGDVHVVRLRGELDFATVSELKEGLRDVKCSTLQVDLSKLTFCDAVGLSALIAAKHERRLDGCNFAIVGAQGIVRRVFEVTGLVHELDD